MSNELHALSVREISRQLGVDRKTVYRLIQRGALRAIRVGRVLRVPTSAFDEFCHRDEMKETAEWAKRVHNGMVGDGVLPEGCYVDITCTIGGLNSPGFHPVRNADGKCVGEMPAAVCLPYMQAAMSKGELNA